MNLAVNSNIKRKDSSMAGLIGGFFRFAPGGAVYGISCNHVIADYNHCNTGDIVTDQNDKPIGTLSNWIILEDEIINRAEFALFKVLPEYSPIWTKADTSWKPNGFATPELNAAVDFMKADGNTTRGIISDINHLVKISTPGADYHFMNCLQIDAINGTTFSTSGDSGGAVYAGDELLGIILGINHGGSKTYVVPFAGGILDFVGLRIM